MSDFLSKILERKKVEVEAAAKRVPEQVLRQEAKKLNGRRPFVERLAIKGPLGVNIIAELKRASPSKGCIRDDIDPGEYAGKYETGGAAAISVLTDRDFFKGSPDDLKRIKSVVTLPALRKDFIISSYQIYESAAIGADAVLLIVRALLPESLREMLSLCSAIGLDALVEVHDEGELDVAMKAEAKLIGINNRDLVTFKTDISTSIRLARKAGSDHVLVAESGIRSRADIERLLDAGIWNFLIGESLMIAEDPVKLLKKLHGAGE